MVARCLYLFAGVGRFEPKSQAGAWVPPRPAVAPERKFKDCLTAKLRTRMLTPLQVVDSFLLNYNVGDVLLLVTVLGAVGIFLQRSNKVLSLHLLSLGLLFLILPANMFEPAGGSLLGTIAMYKFVGLGLMVVAPVIFAVSRR